MLTEKEKYLQWHTEESKNGLDDVKFLVNKSADSIDEEAFYAEANLINKLHSEDKSVERPDVF